MPPEVTQHPVAQLVASHVGTRFPQTFRLDSQTSKPEAMQSLHFPPNEPQACTSDPTRHTPRASQQPVGHVDGPHVPPSVVLSTRASVMVPPSRMASSRLERPQPTAEAEASPATNRRESASRTTRAKEVGEAKGEVSRMGVGLGPRLAVPEQPMLPLGTNECGRQAA